MTDNPTLAVRFEGDDVDLAFMVREAREEAERSGARLALAESLISRRDELTAWLARDDTHPRLLLSEPRAALQQAFPDLDVPEITTIGRELVTQLLGHHPDPFVSVVVHTPPEVFALRLLLDVANDAASGPAGYDELFADIRGTVTRVEAGRYGSDVINRVVDGISRAHGPASTPAPSGDARPSGNLLAAFLAQHPAALEHLQ